MRTVRELGDALYDCFKDDLKVDEYTDTQVAKYLKKFLGNKKFNQFDLETREEWIDAWDVFTKIKLGKLNR